MKDEGDASRKAEIENFHKILMDVSMGVASDRVRQFIIRAYVKGMLSCGGTANNCELEGSTSVFTKRRYRDRWNRTVIHRIASVANHSLKIKGRVRGSPLRKSPKNLTLSCDWSRALGTLLPL